MKKHQKRTGNSPVKSRRFTVIVLATVALLGFGAATAISRQSVESSNPPKPHVTDKMDKHYITVKVGGQDVQVDNQTGKIKPLTPQEAEKMAKGLKELLNQSTEGLVQVHHPDGSVSMHLQDRFQNVTVARIDEDGNAVTSCVDNPQAGAAFFGIDPQLVDDGTNSSKPAKQAPAKN